MYNSNTPSHRLAILAAGLTFVLIVTIFVTSWYATCVSSENTIAAQWRENRNSYSAFLNKVAETGGVTQEYTKQFRAILNETMQGRYGEHGGAHDLKFLQEHNLSLDPATFTRLQTVIEAGRNDFAREQRSLINRQQTYLTHLQSPGGNLLNMVFNFPRTLHGTDTPTVDRDGDGRFSVLDYEILVSAAAKKAFETGTDEPLQPFAH